MGYTETQRKAIEKFRKKFSTNTKTVIDEKEGESKPLTDAQKKRLETLSQKLSLMMCRS